MTTPVRLGAFTLGLAAVFGVAFGTGRLTGPVGTAAEKTITHGGQDRTGHGGDQHGGHDAADDGLPGGLTVSEHGYTLATVPGAADEFTFRIIGPDGRPVTAFDIKHDRRMHLIVVRRDLSGFRHVHPRMDADGTWRVASPMSGPGAYRAFADFTPADGNPLTLGIDTAAAGDITPRPLPVPATTTTVDGYTVRLDGTLTAGRSSRLVLSVAKDGRPVTDLQPYLAAYGHLVALRAGDLAYLHVHPGGTPGGGRTTPGPAIAFYAEVPTAGTYRLYLDFQHGGVVHTAEFTAVATSTGGDATTGDHQH